MSVDEKQLDHCWEVIIKPALMDYFKALSPVQSNHKTDIELDLGFNLSAISWPDRGKNPAAPDAPWSWAFVYDKHGNMHHEVKPLYDEVCRYGEVHTQGFVITLTGNKKQLLNKRALKD